MTYDFNSVPEMLSDPICWEGVWSLVPFPECNTPQCPHCANTPGFCFISCIICRKKTSQCYLISLHGICRVQEDHCCGYPVAHCCMLCFPSLNETLSNLRLAALPPLFHSRQVYQPLKKWFLDNWNFFNQYPGKTFA